MDIFDISDTVRRRRKDKGLTQQQLANTCGLSRTRVNALESGQVFDMKLSNVLSILNALGMSLRVSDARDGRPSFEDIRKEVEDDIPGMG